jgi:hypothetical protein
MECSSASKGKVRTFYEVFQKHLHSQWPCSPCSKHVCCDSWITQILVCNVILEEFRALVPCCSVLQVSNRYWLLFRFRARRTRRCNGITSCLMCRSAKPSGSENGAGLMCKQPSEYSVGEWCIHRAVIG